jgi:hypothetical protein
VSDPAIYRAEVERFYLIERVVMDLLRDGHALAAWLRRGDESIAFCTRCDARVYLRTSAPVIRDGEAFETDCRPV